MPGTGDDTQPILMAIRADGGTHGVASWCRAGAIAAAQHWL